MSQVVDHADAASTFLQIWVVSDVIFHLVVTQLELHNLLSFVILSQQKVPACICTYVYLIVEISTFVHIS